MVKMSNANICFSKNLMFFYLLMFTQIVAVSTDATDNCPQNCSCKWATGVIDCSYVDKIPMFIDRSLIHELKLSPHNITEIKKDHFQNFTDLRILDISRGCLQIVANNAFDDIKSTIERIDLNSNNISAIPADLFKDMPKLENVEINYNQLKNLTDSIFVNLPILNFVKLEVNAISKIGDELFKNVSSLESVYFTRNKLTQIPYRALQNVPALKHLYLSYNDITSIGDYSFQWPELVNISLDSNKITEFTTFPNITPSLYSLDVEFNKIVSLSSLAWTNLSSISSLNLNGNPITSFSTGIFRGLPGVTHLFMRNMPVVESIDARVFTDLKSVRYIDASVNPKLKYIHEEAFTDSALTNLYLDQNNLTTLSQSMLPLLTLDHLDLGNNSWECDCKLRWILDPDIDFKTLSVKMELRGLTCANPSQMKGKQVGSLKASEMVCVTFAQPDMRSRIATGAVVATVCLLGMSLFAILFKSRNKIAISARKYFQYRRFRNDAIFTVANDTVETELSDVDHKRELDEETVQLTMDT